MMRLFPLLRKKLRVPKHRRFVGPPELWESNGRNQFELLLACGLKPHHYLLDFGCGSLRAGRFMIRYLAAEHYFGLEPNRWLVEAGLRYELGRADHAAKRPRFAHNDDFDMSVFGRRFDFVLAHSILSHTGNRLMEAFFANAARVLEPTGVVLATYVSGERDFEGEGWVYPGSVRYRFETVAAAARRAGLEFVSEIAWRHPGGQKWMAAGFTLPPSPAGEPTTTSGPD